jgi:hypothetical protein
MSAAKALGRTWAPAAGLVIVHLVANRALSGEWGAAGAIRKLLVYDPYSTPVETAGAIARNVIVLFAQGFDLALGGAPFSWLWFALAMAAVVEPRTRRLALALGAGAAGCLALVSLNATARFQNLRYATPSIAMLVVAAILGVVTLARRPSVRFAVPVLVLVAMGAPLVRELPRQIDHFARASANIVEQQVEVGHRLAALVPTPRRVFVGDAGAIPYMSGLPALDGLGLGGFRGLPFARASVHGVPAVVELIERMAPSDRPDVFALYPSWWQGLADEFGRRIDAVRIDDNIVCAADEKVIYRADWSALEGNRDERPDVIDRLDVADLVAETEHGYDAATPRGGWVVGRVLKLADGTRRFDAGRIVPEGRHESFAVAERVSAGPATLVLRTDPGEARAIEIRIERPQRGTQSFSVEVPARPPQWWFETRLVLSDVRGGDRITILARRGAWTTFTAWLVR